MFRRASKPGEGAGERQRRGHGRALQEGRAHARYFEFPAGKPVFALALGDDGVLREHDVASGKLVREYPKHTDRVYAVAVRGASARVATGGFDGTVRVWDTKTGAAVTEFVAAPGLKR
jgi:WD40 repeat protein